VLRGVVAWDRRRLDAHAQLGLLAFDAGCVEAALAHYVSGVWVAEQSLPDPFDRVLWWGWVDNRPFLRCLHGLMISAWRVGDLEPGETLCWRLLWLSPGDHIGASDLLLSAADRGRALAFMIGALGPWGVVVVALAACVVCRRGECRQREQARAAGGARRGGGVGGAQVRHGDRCAGRRGLA
jgi:hypothetical protein